MLSRDADSCFWIGRYIERAEATARMVDVHYHFGLEMPRSGAEIRWSSILAISGGEELYDSRYDSEDERGIIQFFAFDLGVTGNSLSPRQDVGIAFAKQGKYIGNFIHNDGRLFAVAHKPEAFGNGVLNIVAT